MVRKIYSEKLTDLEKGRKKCRLRPILRRQH